VEGRSPSVVVEPARLLHARSQYGYTHVAALALPGEPEAVPEEVQLEFTRRAHLQLELRKRSRGRRLVGQLGAMVEELERSLGSELAADVRALARAAARLDRKLT
jgi:hypothetical protein